MSITIRFLRERGDLRWRAIECVLVFHAFVVVCILFFKINFLKKFSQENFQYQTWFINMIRKRCVQLGNFHLTNDCRVCKSAVFFVFFFFLH